MFDTKNIKPLIHAVDSVFRPIPNDSNSDENISIQSIREFLNSGKYKKNQFLYESKGYLWEMENLYNMKAGFCLMDYEQYSSILNSFKIKDDVFRKEKIEEIQKEIPTLSNSKNFKKTVGLELDNRIILNPKINQEAQEKLVKESIYINFKECDDFRLADEYSPVEVGISLFGNSFYASSSKDNLTEQFYFQATTIPFKIEDDLEAIKNRLIIKDEENIETVGSIEVRSNKLIFFDKYNLQTKFPTNYHELIIECNNGTFKIQKYMDSVFRENIKKGRDFYSECKDKKLLEEFCKTGSELQKALDERKKIYLDKYKLTESGVCFYFIDFTEVK